MITREQFGQKITDMIHTDSNYHGSGHMTVTDSELKNFIEHLWKFFLDEGSSYSPEELARALIATDGRYQSNQDRAKAIIKNFQIFQ